MKRELEDDVDTDGAGEQSSQLKRRRGEGAHVELRVLLASKVCV